MTRKNLKIIGGYVITLVVLVVSGIIYNKITDRELIDEDVAAFFRGKNIVWIIPYSPGGGYDEYARLIAPYLSKYTGARVDITNLPGAGGMRGVNELYRAPNTGLTIGMINGSALVTNELAGIPGANYELDKFEYLGRIIADPRVLIISNQSGYASFEDIMNSQRPLKIGATGLGGSTYVDAVISNMALELENIEIIHGFDSSSNVRQAMLRGNIIGGWGSFGSAEDGVDSGYEVVVLQSGRDRIAKLPDVPTVFEFINKTSDPARAEQILSAWDALIEVGRSVAVPPETPANRVDFLQEAFRRALADPELLETAERGGRPIDYESGDRIGEITRNAINMPEDIKQLFIRAIKGQI
jgi:tripartite-type tricarboxylate transporter receptor subunit TctC